jgi:hypothetical protein
MKSSDQMFSKGNQFERLEEDAQSLQNTRIPQEHLTRSLANLVVDFGPLQRVVGKHVWTTELDRVLIMRVDYHEEPMIWIRLIGPACNLNLHLNAPDPTSSEGIMGATTEPIPERHADLIEARVTTRGCIFADVYVILRQFGLDEWTFFPKSSAQDTAVESLSWT